MSPSTTFEAPPAVNPSLLPSANSPNLHLVPTTPEEAEDTAILNSKAWSGPLGLETYLRREKHLHSQNLSREGGLSSWILIDSASKQRDILAACETLCKRAIVARRGVGIEEVIAHGIGSVYCRDEYRGRGYAGRMMQELGQALRKHQQPAGEHATFNVLFSDIGKTFYAKSGWIPYPCSHIDLKPSSMPDPRFLDAKPLHAEDLAELCAADERYLRQRIVDFPADGPGVRVAFLPDIDTIKWQHSREEFLAKELLDKTPEIKGSIVTTAGGTRAWCIWTRTFGKDETENMLYVLRLVVEGDDYGIAGDRASDKNVPEAENVRAVAACLHAAQREAATWNLPTIQFWNPSKIVVAAAASISPLSKIVHRETESIPCLNWYGPPPAGLDNVEWVINEKYGWC